MNLSNAQSGPDAPIRGFGEDGDAYLQTHPGGHTTIWTRTSGVWTATGNVSTGGGSSPSSEVVQVATETLNDAQIIALPSVGVEVVPAPGAGKYISLISAFVFLDCSGGVYTGVTNASLTLLKDGGGYLTGEILTENGLGNAIQTAAWFPIPSTIPGSGDFAGEATTLIGQNLAVDNKSILIKDDYDGLSNYGGGNAANTLNVTVYYTVIDLS